MRVLNRRISTILLAGISTLTVAFLMMLSACESLGQSTATQVPAPQPSTTQGPPPQQPTPPTEQIAPLTQAQASAYVPDVDEPSSRGLIQRVTPADLHVTWRFDVDPTQGRVVFSGYERNSSPVPELWMISATGGPVRKVTSGSPEGAYSPSFTSDGNHIVFESGGSLWVIRSDGTGGRRKIPGSGVGIDVNPDVNKNNIVVFTSAEKQRYGSSSSSQSQQTPTITQQRGGRTYDQSDYRYVIWTTDFEGRNMTQLREGRYPRWSPDGSKIVFEHLGDIWMINADGTELTQLTWTNDVEEGLPSFTPDGKSIVYVSNATPRSGKTGDYQVWIMNIDGTNKTQITQLGGWNSWPQMTPSALYFLSGRANEPAAPEKYQRLWRINKTDWFQQ